MSSGGEPAPGDDDGGCPGRSVAHGTRRRRFEAVFQELTA